MVTLYASVGKVCANITIVNDDEEEEDEYFDVNYRYRWHIAGPRPMQGFGSATYRTYIIDDDCKLYQIDSEVQYKSTGTCRPDCVNGLCRLGHSCECREEWIGTNCSITGLM